MDTSCIIIIIFMISLEYHEKSVNECGWKKGERKTEEKMDGLYGRRRRYTYIFKIIFVISNIELIFSASEKNLQFQLSELYYVESY